MASNEKHFGNNFRWIDVCGPTREEIDNLKKEFNFNHHLLRDCLDPDHLPKYDIIEGVHFLIIRYYNHAIDNRAGTIQELSSKIAIFYTEEFLITIHRNELTFLNNIQKKVLGDGFGNTVSEVIIKILRDSIETFNDPGERLSEQVDFFETHIFLKDTPPDQLETLYYVKRKATLCSRLLTLSLEPINGINATTETEAALQDVKDLHLKMTTLYTQAQDDVTNLMNIYLSFSSQKNNEVMKVLTIFSVFFMPITFIVGIYGMNFEYMPELSKKWGYPIVLLTMALVTVIIYKWFKKKKWL